MNTTSGQPYGSLQGSTIPWVGDVGLADGVAKSGRIITSDLGTFRTRYHHVASITESKRYAITPDPLGAQLPLILQTITRSPRGLRSHAHRRENWPLEDDSIALTGRGTVL